MRRADRRSTDMPPPPLDFRAAARWAVWLVLPLVLVTVRGRSVDFFLAAVIGSWAAFRLYEPMMQPLESRPPRYSRVVSRWQALAVLSPFFWAITFHGRVVPLAIGSTLLTGVSLWRAEVIRGNLGRFTQRSPARASRRGTSEPTP